MIQRLLQNTALASADILAALMRYEQVAVLGWQDVKQRYRRSFLGPFWLTLSMAILIATVGLVFSQIYRSPVKEFIPFLCCSMIFWGFVSTTISESCFGFISAEGIIKQLPIPLYVHILRVIWRNIIILGHNLVIFPIVLIIFTKPLTSDSILAIPGFLLMVINLGWVALVLGVICARYRDLPQIVNSMLQILIYLTPILWMPESISQGLGFYLVQLNPVFHLFDIVRAPLLGYSPEKISWFVSIFIAFFGWIGTLFFYNRYKQRIVFWL